MRMDRRGILEFLAGVATGAIFSYFAVVFLYPWLESLTEVQRWILLGILLLTYFIIVGSNKRKKRKLRRVM